MLYNISNHASQYHPVSYYTNINYLPTTLKKIADKTYAKVSDSSYLINFACNDLQIIYQKQNIKALLDIYAVKTHYVSQATIKLVTPEYQFEKNAVGIYNWDSSIEISTKHINEYLYRSFAGIIIHEVSHSALDFIFNNWANPYFSYDQYARNSFEMAEKWTLLNLSRIIDPHVDLNFDQSSWQLGKEILKRYEQNDCYINDHACHRVIEKFMEVFRFYPEQNNHCEFVVRYYQILAEDELSSYALRLTNPLAIYIRDFVNPNFEINLLKYNAANLLDLNYNQGRLVNQSALYDYYYNLDVMGEEILEPA